MRACGAVLHWDQMRRGAWAPRISGEAKRLAGEAPEAASGICLDRRWLLKAWSCGSGSSPAAAKSSAEDAPVYQWELTTLRAFAHCSDQSVVLPMNSLGKILR